MEEIRISVNIRRMRLIARIWSAFVIGINLFILFGHLMNYFTTGEMDPHTVDDYPPIENVPPLLNSFSAFSLAASWKWEYTGSVVTILLQLSLIPIYLIHWPLSENIRYLIAPYGLILFYTIPAVLFYLCGRRLYRKKGS